MKGYCVIVTDDDNSPFLVKAEEGVPPEETIKKKLMISVFSWFVVRDFERLSSINWPTPLDDTARALHHRTMIQVYRAFEVRQITLDQALNALDNPVITRAQGLGWTPPRIVEVLIDLAWATELKDQAEAYRDSIMAMIEDTQLAVASTESIYEQNACEFLEKEDEDEPSGPKAPEDMTDEEVIKEATQLHKDIYVAELYDRDDLFRLQALEAELLKGGYEIRAGTDYSVQKQEEE